MLAATTEVPTTTDVPTLTWGQTLVVMAAVLLGVLLVGLIVILGRSRGSRKDPRASLVRSWIAISLVLGLLLFCASAFAVADASLRSTLVGALAAAVGTAIAFYFSSHQADQARRDLLTATVGSVTVPKITGVTLARALATLAKTSLLLQVDPASAAFAEDDQVMVASQDPNPDVQAQPGSAVRVTLTPPTDTPAA
jgi:FtsH-binding integral membrane protein